MNIEKIFETQRLITSLKNITNDMDIITFKAFICALFCEYCEHNGMENFQAIDDICEAVREYNHKDDEIEENEYLNLANKIFGF